MKITSNLCMICLLLLSTLISSGAVAVPIVSYAERQVYIGDDASGKHFGPNSPSNAQGVFDDDVILPLGSRGKPVNASQNSDIQSGSGLFQGSGSVSVGFSVLDTDGVYALSSYLVEFDISSDYNYSLSGSLYANMDGGLGVATFSLIGPTGLLFSATNWESTDLLSSGILLAGSYQLLVTTDISNGGNPQPGSYMGGESSFDFDFLLSDRGNKIPESGSLFLLIIGLLGLGLGCRKHIA